MENNPAADEEHFLDPLMEVLSKYRSLEDLIASVSMIFHRLDLAGSAGLGFDELKEVWQRRIYLESAVAGRCRRA